MADPKTQRYDDGGEDFLNGLEKGKRRRDAFAVLDLMKQVTREGPVLWGNSIVGFGSYRYRYASGREGETSRHEPAAQAFHR